MGYKLDLPPSCKIHPVFDVSLLKPHKGNPSIPSTPVLPPNFIDNPTTHITTRQVIKRRCKYLSSGKVFHQRRLHERILTTLRTKVTLEEERNDMITANTSSDEEFSPIELNQHEPQSEPQTELLRFSKLTLNN